MSVVLYGPGTKRDADESTGPAPKRKTNSVDLEDVVKAIELRGANKTPEENDFSVDEIKKACEAARNDKMVPKKACAWVCAYYIKGFDEEPPWNFQYIREKPRRETSSMQTNTSIW